MPDFILNSPELYDCEVPYFNAFIHLDGDRQATFGGIGSIPFMSIVQYGQYYLELDGEELEDFIDIMVLTDNFFIQKVLEDTKETK